MKIGICAIGKMKKGPEQELLERYLKRAKATGRSHGLTGFDVIQYSESQQAGVRQRKSDEAKQLLSHFAPTDFVIALDERGKDFSTAQLHQLLNKQLENNVSQLYCVIGGPDGHDSAVIERSNCAWALSKATWPHQLVRVLVAEQLYRCTSIFANHPYHRSGSSS